jgi:peptidoglycan/LPS O-acetylase OafA/YrhL
VTDPVASSPAKKSTRIAALDAVRGMAILCVIATHSLSATVASTGSYDIPQEVFRAFDFGQFGVQVFFVLSGWLMFALYWGKSDFSSSVYWTRRIARIWPLWVIFLAVAFLVNGIPDSGLPGWLSFLLGASFLGWLSAVLVSIPLGGLTIQQEMGHYLLFSFFRRRGATFLALTVIVGFVSAFVARAIAARAADDSVSQAIADAWSRLGIFNSWPFFLLGGAAFVIFHRWRTSGVNDIIRPRSWSSVFIAIALLLGMLTTFAQDTPGYFVLGYVVFAIAIAVAGNATPVIGPVLRSIGRYSYFMYFFHFWVLKWLESRYTSSSLPGDGTTTTIQNLIVLAVIFVLTVAISWAAGLVSWNVLEKRVMAWAHSRVPAKRSTPPVAA